VADAVGDPERRVRVGRRVHRPRHRESLGDAVAPERVDRGVLVPVGDRVVAPSVVLRERLVLAADEDVL
jgi:hypothetical protein